MRFPRVECDALELNAIPWALSILKLYCANNFTVRPLAVLSRMEVQLASSKP